MRYLLMSTLCGLLMACASPRERRLEACADSADTQTCYNTRKNHGQIQRLQQR